ncbi:SRPBCC family protein [Ohtaekwangia sp.]|uniref:SRPBCC family protein n=1 Tax=Ohtaekwangia sp. TaxID=2066019 RepID=UPI002FDE866B
MNNTALFDFTVDKTAKTVSINMEFDADPSLVWDAFTVPEILDQWWAPKPYISRTKYMDFKVGGQRFYAMVSPEGQERWSIQRYTSITPKTNFKIFNCFADKDENPQLPGSDWDLNFSEHEGPDGSRGTLVSISVYNESLERMESLLEGFKLGMAATLESLKNLLATLSKK